ncbi:MAG: CbtA family protein [Rhodospirillales bacterium]|nr:CbtA family protein [Rhodospirillales bacterium]
MLNRILAVALIAGALTGVAVTGLQMVWAIPLIQAAETYEAKAVTEPKSGQPVLAADGHAHSHGPAETLKQAEWAPKDGFERTFWTLLTNVLMAVGAGLIMAAAFSLKSEVDLPTGLAWGGAAFLAFALAPAMGLPPELPGTQAADITERRLWWALTTLGTAAGLALVYYGPQTWMKAAGLVAIILPHLIGAPHPEIRGALAPVELQNQFILASLTTSLVFWVLMGALTGFLTARFGAAASPQHVPT